MSNTFKLVRTTKSGTQTAIVPRNINEVKYDDPSVWLSNGDRPTLEVDIIGDEKANLYMKAFTASSEVPDELDNGMINALLYYLVKKHIVIELSVEKNMKKGIVWQAGKKNIEDIFKVSPAGYSMQNEKIGESSLGELAILSIILANYRLQSITATFKTDYVNAIKKALTETFQREKYVDSDEHENYYNAVTWAPNKDFRKIVAAVDLLLTLNPEHKLSPLRKATLPARLKDCAIIGEMNYFVDMMNEDENTLYQQTFDSNLSKEVFQVAVLLEKFVGEYSFYLREFGVMEKSPFSVSANPHLHNWIHMVGCFMASSRSFRSRLMDAGANVMYLNALALVYTYKDRTGITAELAEGENRRVIEQMMRESEREDEYGDAPATAFQQTLQNLRDLSSGSEAAAEIKSFAKEMKEKIAHDREGSIGHFVYNRI